MICDERYTPQKCAKLPLNVPIINRVAVELCANACSHKSAFSGRRFQDKIKAVLNYGTGRNEE